MSEEQKSVNESIQASVRRYKSKSEAVDYIGTLIPKLDINFKPFTEDEVYRIVDTLSKYADLFISEGISMGAAKGVEHTIETGSARPISQPPRRMSPSERALVHEMTTEMLHNKVISPSNSPWSSPIVLVKKKDGKQRFCIDFRKLNDITTKDAYPIPRIDDCLNALGGNKFFSSFDLHSGYWQIPMAIADKSKTAFIVDGGLFEFNVMPFGLTNATATFQRYMDLVLSGLKWNSLLVYLDDICVFSKTLEEHLDRLTIVFERFRKYKLKLNASKCQILKEEFRYLGHIVSREGIKPDPKKIEAVLNMPRPTNHKQLRSFLGMCNYYRKFIKDYNWKCATLYELLTKDFAWTDKAETWFLELRQTLATMPMLSYPDFERQFKVSTDASDYGIGAVLSQTDDQSMEKVIQYISRTLQPAERKWCVREKEALAIIYSIETFRPYLYGTHFIVETDHHSLQWLMKATTPPRLVRWALRLTEYDFTIRYKHGDALSRLPLNNDNGELSSVEFLNTILTPDIMKQTIELAQRDDPELRELFEQLENEEEAPQIPFCLKEGQLYYCKYDGSQLLVIPCIVVPKILELYHSHEMSVHMSRDRMYALLRKRFFWKGMFTDISNWIKSCSKCSQVKTNLPRNAGLLEPIQTKKPFEIVAMDIMGPVTKSPEGYQYILNCVDLYTSWPESIALKSLTAIELIEAVHKIILSRHGCPTTILKTREQIS